MFRVRKEGFLKKKSDWLGQYNDRFFRLDGAFPDEVTLTYWLNDKPRNRTWDQHKPKGRWTLNRRTMVDPVAVRAEIEHTCHSIKELCSKWPPNLPKQPLL